jgi:gas vesicle protein
MAKKRLITSMVIGAAVGGIAALFDWDTRNYTKHKLSVMRDKSSDFFHNPTQGIRNARIAVEEFSEGFTYQAQNAVNALEQVENSLGKLTRTKRIEG